MHLRAAAVLGAGTMGAQIAAHLANAGLDVVLLDVTRQAAAEGLRRACSLKPDPFFTPDLPGRIKTGGIDLDLGLIDGADWIVEAVVEDLRVKAALLARVDALRRPDAVVSSNTSGLSIAALAEGRSLDFRRHWLGTHFFNPPRYLHLLELVPTEETDRAVADLVAGWADRRLGKGVVVAKDTPGFIANHLAMYGLVARLRRAGDRGVHGRGNRRDDRPGDWPRQERDVSHGRHRRAGRAHQSCCRSRGASAEGARRLVRPPAIHRRDAAEGLDRGEGGRRLLPASQDTLRSDRDLVARSAGDDLPSAAGSATCRRSRPLRLCRCPSACGPSSVAATA